MRARAALVMVAECLVFVALVIGPFILRMLTSDRF
jgi:hypothetical protein